MGILFKYSFYSNLLSKIFGFEDSARGSAAVKRRTIVSAVSVTQGQDGVAMMQV
jgi:hypothetical protein